METPFKIVAVEPHFYRVVDAHDSLVFNYETDDVAKDMEEKEYQQLKDIVEACNWLGARKPDPPQATKTFRDELAVFHIEKFGRESAKTQDIAKVLGIPEEDCFKDSVKTYCAYIAKRAYEFADAMLAARGKSS